MASSTLSARTLITSHLTDASRLSNFRHQLLTPPAHDLLDTATASQLFAATLLHLKSLSTRGYQQLFKVNNIADLVTSPFLTLTFYCFMTFLAFHTKTITSCTAYALGLVISLVMILETYNTIHAMMMRLEVTSQHIRTVGTYLLFATDPSGLLISWFGMGIEPGLDHEYSPRVDYIQKEDNAAKTQQHRKEPSRSKTKVQLHNDPSPGNHYALKADEDTKRQQDNNIPYVLDAPQHNRSKAQPTTYKSISPDLNIKQEPNMQTAEDYFPPQILAIQPSESTFQMTLRNSMHRSKRPSRTMKSRMNKSVKEYSSQDSYFNEEFRMSVCSEDESSPQYSETSTPDSECSTSTTESDFQTDLLRMMLGSACGIRKRGRKARRSDLSIVDENEYPGHESAFQKKFRQAVWPAGGSKIRTGTPESGNESEE